MILKILKPVIPKKEQRALLISELAKLNATFVRIILSRF